MQSRGPTWVLGTYAMYTIWNHLHEIGQREDGEMFVPMSDPERWRITAGRRFCPMVGFYRNAIETARADRRARRAWFGSALHCSINWQCSNVVGRGACVFALSIGCSGIVPLTDKSMALACRYRPATRKAGILTMDRIRDPERSKNRYARFWRAAYLLRAGKRTVSM